MYKQLASDHCSTSISFSRMSGLRSYLICAYPAGLKAFLFFFLLETMPHARAYLFIASACAYSFAVPGWVPCLYAASGISPLLLTHMFFMCLLLGSFCPFLRQADVAPCNGTCTSHSSLIGALPLAPVGTATVLHITISHSRAYCPAGLPGPC